MLMPCRLGDGAQGESEAYWRGKIDGLRDARDLITRAATHGQTFEQ